MDRSVRPVLSIALFALVLGGCGTTPKPPTAPETSSPANGAMTAGIDSDQALQPAPWENPTSPIYRRVIYFGYDRSDIPSEYVPLLRTHADWLARHPDNRVTIEGHTDERGTREYNLALGDQRANAVRRFLIAEGVREAQLDTLSYGEEKPASPGQGESSWSRNRRAELDYQGG
ncbi:peptidoglycan-associated lipoprotein Pal [Thiococcus pfennigii]|uniref:peptidoglycan-associated lipoprotein Pal n=1 Tax=Thiococcus pfennigii TaxID=1057 RepID=UPI0019068850|nr:peptidoglycan-associated lipoprotein [Thiococcus pfennigii]